MSFDPIAIPIDYVIIGGQVTPGIARIRDASDKRKWDVQTGPYLSGGITIYRGVDIAHPKMDLYLLSAQDWADFYAFIPLLQRPPRGARPKALAISHPWTDLVGIRAVQVEEIHQPELYDETGGYVVTVDLIQFNQPKIALAKPEAAQEKPSDDPYDKIIANLLAQNQAELAK